MQLTNKTGEPVVRTDGLSGNLLQSSPPSCGLPPPRVLSVTPRAEIIYPTAEGGLSLQRFCNFILNRLALTLTLWVSRKCKAYFFQRKYTFLCQTLQEYSDFSVLTNSGITPRLSSEMIFASNGKSHV